MKKTETNVIKAEVWISECDKYRYFVNRIWDEEKEIGAFVCLNPSKATSLMSDTTLSNCNNLSLKWEWGGFYIINLFAYRATDKNMLKLEDDPEGPKNNQAIVHVSNIVDQIVLAWGNGYKKRADEVKELLNDKQLYCLKINKGGGYLHPGRIKVEDYQNPVLI